MVLWRRTTVILTALALASFLASEVFAWSRGFHPRLGAPLVQLGVWPVYGPWAIWGWLGRWGWLAPHAFTGAGIVFALVFGGLVIAGLWPRPPERPQARWATRRSL